jgi:hypothetical protein
MRSTVLQLLHEDKQAEINKGTKGHCCGFLSQTQPNSHTVDVHCCRLLRTQRQSACHVQRLTVQHIYCTNTVQTVQSIAELYLQQSHTTCRYTTAQHIYCTNTVQTVQSTAELYLQ